MSSLLIKSHRSSTLIKYLFFIIMGASFIFSLLNLGTATNYIITENKIKDGILIIDNIHTIIRSLLLIIILIFGINYLSKSEFKIIHLIYLIGVALSSLILISSLNLFISLLAIEIFYLSSLFLYFEKFERNDASKQKFLLLGFFVTAIFFISLVLIYGLTFSINYFKIQDIFRHNSINLFTFAVSVILFLFGFIYKVFLVPVRSLRTSNGEKYKNEFSILLLISAILFFIFLFRFLIPFFSMLTEESNIQLFDIFNWKKILPIISSITIVISSIFLITTEKTKTFFFLSLLLNLINSIILFSYFNISFFVLSFNYFLFTICVHLFFYIALFLCPFEIKFTELKDLRNVFHRSKIYGIILVFIILSLIGFPFTLGFWIKVSLLKELFASVNFIVLITTIANFIITTFIYFKLINLITSKSDNNQNIKLSMINILILAVLLIGIIIFSIEPDLWFDLFYVVNSSIEHLFL
ncbi:MAG: hypothetical protein JXA99_11840 [Candidatus Lokiarchaeota archaeon]|nr:hypothetical protein [Candidatus Lokiarchaeota archaeon]